MCTKTKQNKRARVNTKVTLYYPILIVPGTMSDAFSMVMAIVSIFSAVFILVLVASFAWVCVRALSIEDSLSEYYDNDSKLMREPLIDHIYAHDAKVSDIEISTCV